MPRLEALERLVEVYELDQGRRDEDGEEQVGQRLTEQRTARMHDERRHSLGGQHGKAAKDGTNADVRENGAGPEAGAVHGKDEYGAEREHARGVHDKCRRDQRVPERRRIEGRAARGADAAHHRHGADDREGHAGQVPRVEALAQQRRRNKRIREQRHGTERRDERGGRQAIRDKVARLAEHHQQHAHPPQAAANIVHRPRKQGRRLVRPLQPHVRQLLAVERERYQHIARHRDHNAQPPPRRGGHGGGRKKKVPDARYVTKS